MKLSGDLAAVVTGGASGLGEATARKLAKHNLKVGIFDLDSERGETLAHELGGVFAKVDVGDISSVETGFAKCRSAHGQERILVNCAGVGTAGKTVSKGVPLEADAFETVIRVNLLGSFYCGSRAAAGMVAAPSLSEDGERGLIISTASVAAFDGQIGQVAYAASKAGIAGMTLPMARDLCRDGIRVVSIAPGLFDTPMLRGLPEEVQASLAAQTPFPKRLGNPGEYAALVVHIAQNQMINGETIRLDGAIRMALR